MLPKPLADAMDALILRLGEELSHNDFLDAMDTLLDKTMDAKTARKREIVIKDDGP